MLDYKNNTEFDFFTHLKFYLLLPKNKNITDNFTGIIKQEHIQRWLNLSHVVNLTNYNEIKDSVYVVL